MGKPEETIEIYLKKKAEAKKFLCYKFVSPGHNGVPDRVIIGNGLTVFVETKAPDGKLRKIQEHRIKEMKKNGAIVYVAYTREQVDEIIETIENST